MTEALGIAFQLTFVGMSVVFTALILLVVALTLFKRLDAQMSRPKTVMDQIDVAKTAAIPPPTDELSPDLVAIIGAAVAIATSKKIQITRIRYRGTQPEPSWSRQGRITIMASHQTRR